MEVLTVESEFIRHETACKFGLLLIEGTKGWESQGQKSFLGLPRPCPVSISYHLPVCLSGSMPVASATAGRTAGEMCRSVCQIVFPQGTIKGVLL